MKRKYKRTVKTTLLAGGIFFCIIIFLAFRLYFIYNNRLWNYKGTFTVITKNYKIISYDTEHNEITVFQIPQDAYISIPSGYGLYKISDIQDRARTEAGKEQFYRFSIMLGFGIPIHANEDELTFIDKLRLTLLETIFIRSKRKVVLSDYSIYQNAKQPLASSVGIVDTQKSIDALRPFFVQKDILKSSVRVGVYNTTDVSGIAKSIAGPLSNIGTTVVNIENTIDPSEFNRCRIDVSNDFTAKPIWPKVNQKLLLLFGCAVNISNTVNPRYDLIISLKDNIL